jgi:membrane associated rhomboid family serine protease
VFILPIGHDQQTVRRLPWVTFALIAANFLVFLGIGGSASDIEQRAQEAGAKALHYWNERPYLELPQSFVDEAVPAAARERFKLLVEARRSTVQPPSADEQARQQEELERKVAEFLRLRAAHPYTSWGLVPAHFSWLALLTSLFIHAGWLHLIGNMFMLYLAGPPIEDAYGRPLFAALYLTSGALASLWHVAVFPHATTPLVGASGAIAGVMGAFLVRCFRSKIRFFYWWLLIRAGTFDAPAWLMLPLWLGEQLLYASLAKSEGGVAHWAHVAGFAYGAVAAFAIKATRFEERFIHARIESQVSLEQHKGLQEGIELLATGDVPRAREALQRALRDDPRNPDAHLAMWQSFVQEGKASSGVDHLTRVIEDELRRGERELARDHWNELRTATGEVGSPQLRWRLASELQTADGAAVTDILGTLADDPQAGLLAEKARARLGLPAQGAPSVGSATVPSDAGRTAAIATGASSSGVRRGVVHPPVREAPVATTPDGGPADPPFPTSPVIDWEVETPAGLPEACAPPRPALVVENCEVESLQLDGVVMRGRGGGTEILALAEVEAVAVGGVSGGARPYLVLDLVSRPTPDGSRVAYRLLSTQFDPRRLLEREDLPSMDAFREVVRRLLRGSGARLLPGPDALTRVAIFPDLDAYRREVLTGFEAEPEPVAG